MNRACLFAISVILIATPASGREELVFKKRVIEQDRSRLVTEKWETTQTAVIVCDMWDSHHCFNAVQRVNEMAPRMNQLLKTLRAQGTTIIHAPSSCVGAYAKHPARIHVSKIPLSRNIPAGIGKWCDHIDAEKDYPLDQSDGGEDDTPEDHQKWAAKLKSLGRNPRAPWKRQVASLEISPDDFITDKGEEVWSILDHRNIDNVLMVGVHTNMCVLGRPFGLRQLSRNGKNVVLVRDLTDTMYNPASWPYVDHFQGNRLIHRHIEKYVCGTVTSNQIIGGAEFRFQNDRPQKCVIICAESLYGTEVTLKTFAENVLSQRLGFETTLLTAGKGENRIENLVKSVESADLIVLSARRRALPESQLAAIQDYLKRGKPLVAIRTSSHAFDTKGEHPKGHAEWRDFDSKVLGCNYTGHYPNGESPEVFARKDHPVLTGVEIKSSLGSLYQSQPLGPKCTPLLYGKIAGQQAEPIAWINHFGKCRVFYTSLGHKSDFEQAGFQKLLENGVRWAAGMKIGVEPKRKK